MARCVAERRQVLHQKHRGQVRREGGGHIKAIAISGLYGGSGILLDADMKPVRPCMIWMDRRAQKESDWALEAIGEQRLLKITHNGADPYYGYTKMLWMKRNEPENWAKTRLFLPPNDYIIYKLTGQIAIDYSSAGNIGGIFDMNTRTWSQEMLDAMGIPLSMMPRRLVESTDIVGNLTAESAAELGLWEGLPVIAGGIDCGAANIGLGVFEPGVYAAAIGTSMCAALISDKPVKGQGLIVWPYLYKAKELSYYFAGGATAGAIVKWFRNTPLGMTGTASSSPRGTPRRDCTLPWPTPPRRRFSKKRSLTAISTAASPRPI